MPGLEDDIEFADNPEPRCPCVLLLDISGSMNGDPIAALNAGLQTFKNDIVKDALAAKRVEIAIVTFHSEVKVETDFCTVNDFTPPVLTTGGLTHTGSGIHKALDMIAERKKLYRDKGISYYRPWVFMITDGAPYGESDDILIRASARIDEEEKAKRVAFFAVGVEGADMEKLKNIVIREPMKLFGLNFSEMFIWLSASMQKVSQSKLDEQVALPKAGWGTI